MSAPPSVYAVNMTEDGNALELEFATAKRGAAANRIPITCGSGARRRRAGR